MDPRTDIVQVAALLVAARTVVADPARWCAWPHALDANGHTCEGRSNNAVCWGAAGALDRAASDADASHGIFLEARRQVNRASVRVADSWTGTAWVLDYNAAHSMTVAIFDEAVRAMPRPDAPGAVDILAIARMLIARPDRWAQGAIALDRNGRALSTFDGGCRFCAAGAVGLAAHVLGGDDAARRRIGPAVDRRAVCSTAPPTSSASSKATSASTSTTATPTSSPCSTTPSTWRARTPLPTRRNRDHDRHRSHSARPPRRGAHSDRHARSLDPGRRLRATPMASPSASSTRTPSPGVPPARSTAPCTAMRIPWRSRRPCSGLASASR